MAGTGRATVAFIIFVAVMYIVVFRLIRRESATDTPV
jgi:preprotein translocase subunit YajC